MVGGNQGWLAALNDPHVGRAIVLLHQAPEVSWTVEELARQCSTSRAVLAKRFVDVVGETPIQYLTAWRMLLAQRLLLDSGVSIAKVAARVGYESESTFTRAYRRVVGTPPAEWRRQKSSER